MLDRERAGCAASPSAGVLGSQTVKAPAAPKGGGYDAAKKLKGRKRHVAVDTDRRLLLVSLTLADVQDAAGAERIITAIRQRWPQLRHLFADGAYDRGKLMSKAAQHDFVLEVVRKLVGQQGFQPLPRRWVLERTFGWMMRWRRLVRDHEQRCDVSEAMIHVSMAVLHPGDVVLTPKLDRMFRSALDALHVLDQLRARKVALHMLDLGGDVTGNGISKLVFTILSAVAEAERDRIRERIGDVKRDQRQRGRFLGGRRPVGYRVGHDGELVADVQEQAALAKARELQAEGLSLRKIAAALAEEGVPISRATLHRALAADEGSPRS